MGAVPHPETLKQAASSLRSAVADGLSLDETQTLLGRLCSGFEPLGVTRSHHQVWYRSRICDSANGYTNVRQLIYPSSGSTQFARASRPGAKVLYAGWNVRLSMEEIGAKKGDTVQVILLRVRSPIEFPCVILGEHQAIYNSGRSIVNSPILESAFSRKLQMRVERTLADVFVDSVLAELFREQHEKNDGYATCAVFAERVLARGIGLIYPSVRTAHSANIAVRAEEFDANFEVLGSDLYRVQDYHGYGLYVLKPIQSTWEIDTDGTFRWSSQRRPALTLGSRRDTLIPGDFRGWQPT